MKAWWCWRLKEPLGDTRNLALVAFLLTWTGSTHGAPQPGGEAGSSMIPTYFVSTNGKDSNDGTSPLSAFRSLARLATADFRFGGNVCLEGGRTFFGGIMLDPSFVGGPVTIASCGGEMRATIVASETPGIGVRNLGHITVTDLILVGPGALRGSYPGVVMTNDRLDDARYDSIAIRNVDVSGFSYGVLVEALGPHAGFAHVQMIGITSHDNTHAGIEVAAPLGGGTLPHADVAVVSSTAFRNRGLPGYRSHSGSGIVVTATDRVLIEGNEAFENGELCDSAEDGGPVGIWAFNSNNAVIQFNASHHNHSANGADGGGFDLDGAVTNSVMRYNVSWENDGYGFQLCDFWASAWGAPVFSGNRLHNNVSLRDGRKYDFGAFTAGGPIYDTSFKNNVIVTVDDGAHHPVALEINGWAGSGLEVSDNLVVSGSANPPWRLRRQRVSHDSLVIDRNHYLLQQASPSIEWLGEWYESLLAWQSATCYERSGRWLENAEAPLEFWQALTALQGKWGEVQSFHNLDAIVRLLKNDENAQPFPECVN